MTFRRGFAFALLLLTCTALRAESRLHTQVLVFIPAYEGSQLYDSTLLPKGEDPPCVCIDAIRSATLYFSLSTPNPLDARPMLTAGPIDVYGKFLRHDGGAGRRAPFRSLHGGG